MASRLLRKEAETASGYAPPASVAVAPLPPAPLMEPVLPTLPSGKQVPTVLLARHEIEAELLGVAPRNVAIKQSAALLPLFVVVGCMAFPTALMLTRLPEIITHRPEKLWGALAFLSFLALITATQVWTMLRLTRLPRKHFDLLRTGIPRPAFVETTELINFYTGGRKTTYWYEDAPGHFVSRPINVSPATLEKHIRHSAVFTVLVSETGAETLPYFLADGYTVSSVMRTAVSDVVSVRVAEADAVRVAALARQQGMFGAIEPELLGTVPRRVRVSAQVFRRRQIALACLATVATLLVLYPLLLPFSTMLLWAIFVGQQIVQPLISHLNRQGLGQLLPEGYLRSGVPARALVFQEENTTPNQPEIEKHQITFRYKYESATGRVHTHWVTLTRRRAWQLGLCEGATFTVLYDLKHTESHTPYFQITDAEIVGAMGAKVSPP